jgi:hypothetical protein
MGMDRSQPPIILGIGLSLYLTLLEAYKRRKKCTGRVIKAEAALSPEISFTREVALRDCSAKVGAKKPSGGKG